MKKLLPLVLCLWAAVAGAQTVQYTLHWTAPTTWDNGDSIDTPLTYTVFSRICGSTTWTPLSDATGISVLQTVRQVDSQCHEYMVEASTVYNGMTYTSVPSNIFQVNWGASSSSSSSSSLAPRTQIGPPTNLTAVQG